MNRDHFIAAYEARRDGLPLQSRPHCTITEFEYSIGVHELANAGCYSLIDLIGSECAPLLRSLGASFAHIRISVVAHRANLSMVPAGKYTAAWIKNNFYITLPDGFWRLCLINEGDRSTLILPTEH